MVTGDLETSKQQKPRKSIFRETTCHCVDKMTTHALQEKCSQCCLFPLVGARTRQPKVQKYKYRRSLIYIAEDVPSTCQHVH
ncbi:hypothetical protein CIPAW_05G127800 [Carya illinoinensis]|uniref:Uncharacterized protein n=1 Tax=Carya illinoinensis TaxID=32201 RepID=A0A8T1QIY6_CARIL|nr:hypothetical protein CIPAW_05G127800 [Carya illinoinensis]KAG6712925.1 hypothetical protein I3842_05G125000 [Carya illinoinensis]